MAGQTAPPVDFACSGAGLKVSGELWIAAKPEYDALGGKHVVGRRVYFDRRLAGTSTWTADYFSVVTDGTAAPDDNWSTSFGASTTSSVSYEFRSHFKGDNGGALEGVYGSIFKLTWSSAC